MSRISKTTSTQKSPSIKKRIKFTQNAFRVKKVDPINRSFNDLMGKDEMANNYFDSVFQLTEEYKEYYHNEQKLEEDIKKFIKDDKSLLVRLINLISSYNKTIDSLIIFDYTFHTTYIEIIGLTMNKNIQSLNTIGIFKDEFSKLSIDKKKFIKKIADSKDPTEELFTPLRNMILEVFKILVKVKVPKKNDNFKYSKRNMSPFFQGNVIDTKK
ncbi:MAG: hypothetical protein N4A76_10380 [Firmicutes bacterium]|jgi:hypothetical protein|nr:hypothetical protein [Bacillota bacterium]